VTWLRIGGLAFLIAGALSLLLIPMYGRHIALASAALIIVGTATLAAGTTRRRRFRESGSGGVYGDASGLNTDYGASHHHSGHDGGHAGDGGFGGDGGAGGDGGGH
jgi:hypothetical protein